MIVLGLTGSIGMGKSTASSLLRAMGVPVHESDAAVHRLLAPDGEGVAAILEAFPDTGDKQGGIDRAKLGHVVFVDEKARKKLESILHPRVVAMQRAFIDEQEKQGIRVVVLDIPLLYETGAEARVDYVIVVTAPFDIQRARVMARGLSEEDFRARLSIQTPDSDKRRRADFIVHTDRGLDYTRTELQNIIERVKGPKKP